MEMEKNTDLEEQQGKERSLSKLNLTTSCSQSIKTIPDLKPRTLSGKHPSLCRGGQNIYCCMFLLCNTQNINYKQNQ